MDSIVENRVEFIDLVEKYIAFMSDRKVFDDASKIS
jgi:hypothetical protein